MMTSIARRREQVKLPPTVSARQVKTPHFLAAPQTLLITLMVDLPGRTLGMKAA
jgi:hypothetical protein